MLLREVDGGNNIVDKDIIEVNIVGKANMRAF